MPTLEKIEKSNEKRKRDQAMNEDVMDKVLELCKENPEMAKVFDVLSLAVASGPIKLYVVAFPF